MNNCVTVTRNMFRYRLMVLAYFLWVTMGVCAQAPEQKPGLPELEQMLNSKLGRLDSDEEGKGRLIKDIATEILNVPSNVNRLKLAKKLADLSTNSNADRASVQLAANLLAQTLVEQGDSPAEEKQIRSSYRRLAELIRYENVNPPIHSAELDLALQRLESEDKVRDGADFELADLTGKIWHLNELKGKVVLVSFWATWCPYCRTEMPVLDRLYKSFKDRGLVVLAISDEAREPVQGFADRLNLSFPILLDTGRHSTSVFNLHGIPTTLVYGRKGNLAGEAIDVRTEGQFYELLLKAGFDELGPKNSQRN